MRPLQVSNEEDDTRNETSERVEDGTEQVIESEGRIELTEDDHENKEASSEAGESLDETKEERPAEMVLKQMCEKFSRWGKNTNLHKSKADWILLQCEQDFSENMEDFVTLDELPEDEDEELESADACGVWTQEDQAYIQSHTDSK